MFRLHRRLCALCSSRDPPRRDLPDAVQTGRAQGGSHQVLIKDQARQRWVKLGTRVSCPVMSSDDRADTPLLDAPPSYIATLEDAEILSHEAAKADVVVNCAESVRFAFYRIRLQRMTDVPRAHRSVAIISRPSRLSSPGSRMAPRLERSRASPEPPTSTPRVPLS
jgi:hypothetical protein